LYFFSQRFSLRAKSKSQQSSGMMELMSQDSMMMQTGEKAIGCGQSRTTHRFLLKNEGMIQIEAMTRRKRISAI
jgi:hypothetical protein